MDISTLQTKTPLSLAYFSTQNVNAIQQQIRYKIFLKSNSKEIIGTQDEGQLRIVMRSIYLQYSKNIETNILEQVIDLNNVVIDFCVKQIWTQMLQYNTYLKDIDSGIVPIDREVNLSKQSNILVNNKIGFHDDSIPIGSLL